MADITVPVLESFTRTSGTGLKAGQQVTMLYDVYDESPISTIVFSFRGPTGNSYQVRTSGSNLDTGQASTTVQAQWPDGYYILQSVNIFEGGTERNFSTYHSHGGITKSPIGASGPNFHNFHFSKADFVVGDIAAAHNQVIGTSGPDTLFSLAGHDMMMAGLGDDILNGSYGNDILDGGEGNDTASFASYRRANNEINLRADADDTITSFEGTDTIRSVERYSFFDGHFVTGTGEPAAQIYRLYGATLDRNPDQNGLKGWLSELASGGKTLKQVADGFTSSPEFQQKYGSLDDEAFVAQLYRNVLDREPETSGFDYWLGQLGRGIPRAEVVLNFSESAENIDRTHIPIEEGLWIRNDQVAFVARLYDTTLDRLPDGSGLSVWSSSLQSGMTPQSIADNFMASPEFMGKYGTLDDLAFVQQLYRNVLDREGEASGVEAWRNALQGGMSRADVVLGFSESAEHQNKLAPQIDDGIWLL